jgi:hypothetical protein
VHLGKIGLTGANLREHLLRCSGQISGCEIPNGIIVRAASLRAAEGWLLSECRWARDPAVAGGLLCPSCARGGRRRAPAPQRPRLTDLFGWDWGRDRARWVDPAS